MNSILLSFNSFFLVFTIISNTQSHAQESSQTWSETVDLSFNDNFNYFLDDDVKWDIFNKEGLLVKSGNGPISNLQFEQHGAYSIKIQESKNHDHNKCDHTHFPSSKELKISPYSFSLDFNLIDFSRPLSGGLVDGLEITLPVTYQSLSAATLSLNYFKIMKKYYLKDFSN